MKFELVRLEKFSGRKATIYSVRIEGEKTTLFERFLSENLSLHSEKISKIMYRLIAMGNTIGARYDNFKHNEGKLGDGVCAIYDPPEKGATIRIYCIRYGSDMVILGGGGYKPPNIRTYQEIEKLDSEAELMKKASQIITQTIQNRYSSIKLKEGKFIGQPLIFEEDEKL